MDGRGQGFRVCHFVHNPSVTEAVDTTCKYAASIAPVRRRLGFPLAPWLSPTPPPPLRLERHRTGVVLDRRRTCGCESYWRPGRVQPARFACSSSDRNGGNYHHRGGAVDQLGTGQRQPSQARPCGRDNPYHRHGRVGSRNTGHCHILRGISLRTLRHRSPQRPIHPGLTWTTTTTTLTISAFTALTPSTTYNIGYSLS